MDISLGLSMDIHIYGNPGLWRQIPNRGFRKFSAHV